MKIFAYLIANFAIIFIVSYIGHLLEPKEIASLLKGMANLHAGALGLCFSVYSTTSFLTRRGGGNR